MAPPSTPLARRPLSSLTRVAMSSTPSSQVQYRACLAIHSANLPALRRLHTSPNRTSSADSLTTHETSHLLRDTPPEPQPEDMPKQSPLAVLPLTSVLRTLMTTTISSSKVLLPPSLAIMSILANAQTPLLNPDKNPLLRQLLKTTFYAQFCAGENPNEVRQTTASLRKMGFSGVILGYAKEAEVTKLPPGTRNAPVPLTSAREAEIRTWATGTEETIKLASPGDYIALKLTGAGEAALHALSTGLEPPALLHQTIRELCALASVRGVRLLIDAEHQAEQAGIDAWALKYMKDFNTPERAVVYNTYQAYLKATPQILKQQLFHAQQNGYALGVKLVRGAYIGSDPRDLIHDTKGDTDSAYDGIAEALMKRSWTGPLELAADEGKAEGKDFPVVNLMIASHNRESVLKVRWLIEKGLTETEVAFAQLQGMADEVSCELVAGKGEKEREREKTVQAYKYLVWGSTGECMKYLLRRAHENRDAVERTKNGRDAMRAELGRRVKAWFGLA